MLAHLVLAFAPPLSLRRGSAGDADLLQSVWLGGHTHPIYMGGLHHVAREASFDAKESGESRDVGSSWGVVPGGRRIRGSRWFGRRYTDGERGTGNYSR
jgi:hypothetical protein